MLLFSTSGFNFLSPSLSRCKFDNQMRVIPPASNLAGARLRFPLFSIVQKNKCFDPFSTNDRTKDTDRANIRPFAASKLPLHLSFLPNSDQRSRQRLAQLQFTNAFAHFLLTPVSPSRIVRQLQLT